MSSPHKFIQFPNDFCLKIDESVNLKESLKAAEDKGFSAIITTVVNEGHKREFINEHVARNHLNFTRSPIILSSEEWMTRVIPYIKPPNIGVLDEELRENNERQFHQEINFTLHLKTQSYTLINLTYNDPEALGASLARGMTKSLWVRFLIELPMTKSPSDLVKGSKSDEPEDQWKVWNKFHAATEYSNKVQVALVLTANLPSDEELKRWLGEHIGLLIVPYTIFLINRSNYPTLTQAHQKVIQMLVQYTKCMIAIEPTGLQDQRVREYAEYVLHVIKTGVKCTDGSHDDCLRYPLQPLYDNLETGTYEVFEVDPSKYILYQRAIEAAMIDKIPENEKNTKQLVLMLLGAGRGPLIRAALNACKNTGRKLKILVVEKNPNAIVTLSNLIDVMWPKENITLIASDMRKLNLDEKADIIVSELLGSFGDNELSPECLDGAQHLLKEDGISIPYKSISYLRPVMSSRVMNRIDEEQSIKKSNSNQKDPKYAALNEISWLVNFHSAYYIDQAKKCFEFVHPNHQKPIDNSRHGIMKFRAKIDCTLHGFAGYFTAWLYKDIKISILPETHTQGMLSWFPVFFPVKRRFIKQGETIPFEIWRKVGETKVWYEWTSQDGVISNKDGINHPILM